MPGSCPDGVELLRHREGPDDPGLPGTCLQSWSAGLEGGDGASRQDLRELSAAERVCGQPRRVVTIREANFMSGASSSGAIIDGAATRFTSDDPGCHE